MSHRVFLLCPSFFGYEERLEGTITGLGHTVMRMDERIGNDFMSKAIGRLGLLRLFPKLVETHLERIIEQMKAFSPEILLFMNPETLNGRSLARIKQEFPELKVVIYTWDCQSQKPIDNQSFEIAEAVYSFDLEDCSERTDLQHYPLFHSYNEPQIVEAGASRYDFCFIGTARARRLRALSKLGKKLDEQGRSYFFYIFTQSAIHQIYYRIVTALCGYGGQLSRQRLSYEKFVDVTKNSKCSIDIEFSRQSGLTMRTMEVVFSGVTLLTTNPFIRQYDIYDLGGVFVFDEDEPTPPDSDKLNPVDRSELFEKYSIRTFCKTMVDAAGL